MEQMRRDTGFSLVELMIVIAIIAVLAAIALPSFKAFYMRAKTTEAVKNITTIRSLQVTYKGINDTYLTLAAHPANVPSMAQLWGNPVDNNWEELGFVPDGQVRYQYKVEVGNTGNIATSFKITAQTDFDTTEPLNDTWTMDQNRVLTHTNTYK